MLFVNLLPREEQYAVRLEETRRTIVVFALLAASALAVGFVFLVPSFLVYTFVERELIRGLKAEEEAFERQASRNTIPKAQSALEAISEIRSYAASPPRASALLERFFDPETEINVISLLIRKDGTVFLSGHAATRNQLLQFEEALRSSNRFHEVALPLSNIVRERDIQFTVQGKLKPEYGL